LEPFLLPQELHNRLNHRPYESQPLAEHRTRQGAAAQQVLQYEIREHLRRQPGGFKTDGARRERGQAA
jgi:hypothetical protein